MSRLQPLLERNQAFARSGAHAGLPIMPKLPVFLITCLDPRLDPAAIAGLGLGDAPVIRNAGGRVTDEVLNDVAFIGYLATTMRPDGPLFEVAVIHHTQCGTGFLADEAFRAGFAARSGLDEASLAAEAVTDPEATVRADVARLLGSAKVPSRLSVSGHVYDVETGLITTVVPASSPAPRTAAGPGRAARGSRRDDRDPQEPGTAAPVVDADTERGSRGRQAPRCTAARNRSTAALNTPGSSRLAVWPVRGRMARPADGMVRLSISAVSRQPSSSSPARISTGTATPASSSRSAYSDGRPACTPRMVSAEPSDECPASAAANSAQPRGFLFWNCTRAGPAAYHSATRAAPSRSKAAAMASALGPERGLPLRRRAVACPGHHRGQHPVRVAQHQVQRGETAHGQADHVGGRDAEPVQHGDRVGHRALLRVRRRVRPARRTAGSRAPRS